MPIWVYVLDYILGIVMYTLIGRAAMNIFQREDSNFFFMRIFVKFTNPVLKIFDKITPEFLARPIVPLSNKDIGYLPGNAEDKINPYMQPLFDNLKFIKNQFGEKEKRYRKIVEMEEQGKLKISALAYIRGRSLSNVIFIVDEAQNLTPHEVKTIITRAGENTKIIFTGDVFQIDTPYLDEQSNGLSYLIDRLKGNDLFAHITLEKGERSELANLANQLL